MRDATLTRPAPRVLAAIVAAVLATMMLLAVAVPASAAELLGPDPVPRDAEDNPARELGGYEDREVPFTWGAAWLLTFLGLGGLATMGLVYWRAVDRPGRDKAPARR